MTHSWLKRTLIGVAASAALATGIGAFSQGMPASGPQHGHGECHEHGFGGGPAGMLAHAAHHLTLDANQQAKLQALEGVLKSQHEALEQAAPGMHDRMKALIAGNTFDRAGAQQLSTDVATRMQADSTARINAAADLWDSLNATQQQSLRDMFAKHAAMMQMHFDHKAASTPAN